MSLTLVLGIVAIVILIVIIFFMAYFRTLREIASFAYQNAKLQAIGNRFIHKKTVDECLEGSFPEFLTTLKTADYIEDVSSVENAERSLSVGYQKLLKELLAHAPPSGKLFLEAYLRKLEAQQIKNVFRCFGRGKKELKEHVVPVGRLTPELISKLTQCKSTKELSAVFKQAGIDVVEDEVEYQLDKQVFKALKAVPVQASPTLASPLAHFVGTYGDLMNLKILIRAKHRRLDAKKYLLGSGRELAKWKLEHLAGLSIHEIISALEGTPYAGIKKGLPEYEEKDKIDMLEYLLDKQMVRTVHEIQGEAYLTIGPLIKFIVCREYELRNIRALLRGLKEEIAIEELLILEET